MNNNMFSFFNLPNLFTISNFICGIISIFYTFSGKIEYSVYPLLLAAIFDFFDGFIARMLKCGSELGKQLDSFADLISFGLAPGMIMLYILIDSLKLFQDLEGSSIIITWFLSLNSSNLKSFIPFIAFLIPIFSMLRLAKFNIDERQSDRFIGLPTPANTMFFCTFPFIYNQEKSIFYTLFFSPIFLSIIIIIFSFLLISEIPLFALKFKHFKIENNEIRYLFLILSLISILLFYFWALGIIVILYLILSFVQILIDKNI